MPKLAEVQRDMVAAILSTDQHWRQAEHPAGLTVHRDTVSNALVNALRLTYPTVAALLGAERFRAVAMRYVREYPPRSANLYLYGSLLPESLQRESEMACVNDVARFDLAVDRAAHTPAGLFHPPVQLDERVELRIAASVRCLEFQYAVDLIRDAVEADEPVAPDLTPRPRYLAIWRGPLAASVRPLSACAAAFLRSLLCGMAADGALAAAARLATPHEALSLIQTEILGASFVRISPLQEGIE